MNRTSMNFTSQLIAEYLDVLNELNKLIINNKMKKLSNLIERKGGLIVTLTFVALVAPNALELQGWLFGVIFGLGIWSMLILSAYVLTKKNK